MPAFHDITAAVIGAGFIGPVHVEGLRRAGVRVKGIAGISADEATRAAANLGLPHAYPSVDALLADPEVKRVHVASPNRLHHDHVLAVLKAGKHVVCEKPLAMTSAQTGALVAEAKARPAQIAAVNYNLRFYPLSIHARALVKSGALARCFTSTAATCRTGCCTRLTSTGACCDRKAANCVRWATSERIGSISSPSSPASGLKPSWPISRRSTRHGLKPPSGSIETFAGKQGGQPVEREPVAIDTEDYGAVLLHFAGGARGVLTVSQVTAGRKNCLRYELACGAKALAWNSESPNALWIGERAEANRELLRDPSLLDGEAARFASYPGGHNEGFPDTFKQLYRAVYTDILNGARSSTPLYATFEDGHHEVLLCEAIARSHKEQRWVKVGE